MARAARELVAEVYPEADRLGAFPHPRHTERLFGHAAAEAQLAAGLESGVLHHAWLMTGPAGIGKATLAYRFARAALAVEAREAALFGVREKLEVDPGSRASHLVRALSHPDLLVIRRPYDFKAKRLKTAITVDEVRRLKDFLGHKQAGGGWKVVIVDAADDLNINAANALLKALEEPPARVVFLLISAMPGRLIATIRSRCRVLAMGPLDDGALKAAAVEALEQAEMALPDEAQWPALVDAAAGSVGKLLGLASGDGAALALKVDQVFGNLRGTDWAGVHLMSDGFAAAGAAAEFETFMDLFIERLARLVRAAATGAGSPADIKVAQALRIQGDLASWAELWETLVREKAMQDVLNLDRKAFLMDCVMRLAKLARRG